MKNYDVIILGAGPAGLSAAIYSSRAALKTLVIEKESIGGQIISTDGIENYPGISEGETGQSLVNKMKAQAEKFGVEFLSQEVIDFDFKEKIKVLKTKEDQYSAKGVIIAIGSKHRRLGVKGEDEFVGAGVSYCATCDAAFFKDVEVFVVGGGDTALQESLFLSKFASKVTIVHRREEFRATKILQEKVKQNKKIDFMMNSKIVEIKGDGIVGSVVIEDIKTGQQKEYLPNNELNTFGVFVFTGYIPNTKMFEDKFELDPKGYFVAGEDMKLKDGVYVAGDCRAKKFRQVVTAVADGATAALELERYIEFYFDK